MTDRIDKLVNDLSAVEKYIEELQEIEEQAELKRMLSMDEHEEYTEGIRCCLADDIDNVVETITDFKDALEGTELMSKADFELLDELLTRFIVGLEERK